ncbi:Shedu anti-phage system protein SduA domain-containing protein [Phormidesmis sp. 146-12]
MNDSNTEFPEHSETSQEPDIEQLRQLLDFAVSQLSKIADQDIPKVFREGLLDRFLTGIAPIFKAEECSSIYEYLLAHKQGVSILASVRSFITRNYGIEGSINGYPIYVSPLDIQWYEDGVMFVQGEEKFTGLFGLYQDSRVKFAVCTRDAKKGENLRSSDFLFIDTEEAAKQFAATPQLEQSHLQQAVAELTQLLTQKEERESQYQHFLERYPWSFGAQYGSINSHRAFNDENIPDFSGVRIRDGARDIIEIKNPFLKLFRADGGFTSDFYDSWNQVERYLDFARRDADYLRRQKGLRFENPHCYLIAGYDLSNEQIEMLRAKERMNPAITIFTYNDLLTLIQGTVRFVEKLSSPSYPPANNSGAAD